MHGSQEGFLLGENDITDNTFLEKKQVEGKSSIASDAKPGKIDEFAVLFDPISSAIKMASE